MSKYLDDDDEKNMPNEVDEEEDEEEEIDVVTTGGSGAKSRRRVLMSGGEDEDDEEEEELEDEDEDEDAEELAGDSGDEDEEKLARAAPPGMNFAFGSDDDEDEDDEDEEEDEHYLQKFEDTMKKNIITEFHPEMQSHNSDEIEVLCQIVRDQDGRIIDPLHKSLPFITKYERTRVLGERARQLNAGATAMVEVDSDTIDGYLIALKEFQEKKIPFILKRPIAGNHIEYWKLADLEIL
jgi:DNA-directed RNA polymerase I, II, and III subunit RPABC2